MAFCSLCEGAIMWLMRNNVSAPVGWGDIATKANLDALESRLRAEIQASHAELLHKLFFGLVASNATLVGLVFAAVRLG